MAADIAAVAFVVVIGGGTYWLMMRFLRRRGFKTIADLPPEQRRRFWLYTAVALVILAVCAWGFASGHPAVGIAVLVAFCVLPEFVLLPLRIRRSQRAAKAPERVERAPRCRSGATSQAG